VPSTSPRGLLKKFGKEVWKEGGEKEGGGRGKEGREKKATVLPWIVSLNRNRLEASE